MAKPTAPVPRWATGGGAQITEPTDAKKDGGWVPGERPGAQVFNWFWNRVHQWLAYLDNLSGEAMEWTARHAFEGGISVPASVPGSADAVQRVEMDNALVALTNSLAIGPELASGITWAIGWSNTNGDTSSLRRYNSGLTLLRLSATRASGDDPPMIARLPAGTYPSVHQTTLAILTDNSANFRIISVEVYPNGSIAWYASQLGSGGALVYPQTVKANLVW